jgi:putative cell wall-binding protein
MFTKLEKYECKGGLKMKKLCTVFILVLSMLIQFVPATTVQAEAIATSRLAGDDRYATAVAISQAGWTEADTIIIATGLNYPDALAASSLTKSKDAPILLTRTDAMDQIVVDEIDRLNATQVILVGGSDVVGPGVEDQLRSLGISSITRLGGIDRYDTSVKVGEMLGGTDNGIIIATGLNFPDALSIAPIAAMKSIPILLSPQNALEAYVSAFIANKTIPVSYIAGGSDVVSDSIATGLPNSKRLSGDDRYGTNMSIIKEFAGDLNFDTIYLATGLNFPDALSGSAIAAKNNAPIILTEQDTISQDIINLITSKNVKKVVFLGGTDVVSQNIEDAVNGIVRVESVSLDKSTASMVQAKLMTLTATVKPDTASNKNVTWSSSAPGVASVSSKGVVTAKKAGDATITATTADGNQTATCIVSVSEGKLTEDEAIYANENDNVEDLYVTIVTDNKDETVFLL